MRKPATPARSRIAFHKELALIKNGWTKNQVIAILGSPDDVVERNEAPDCWEGGEEMWSYGTEGHLTPGTLANLHFEGGKVAGHDYFSQVPDPVANYAGGEAALLATLRKVLPPTVNDADDDILTLERAALILYPLGRNNAVGVLKEWSYLRPDSMAPYWVARRLFMHRSGQPIAPPTEHDGLRFNPPTPRNPKVWPNYPILVKDGLPLSLTSGYTYEGIAEWVPSFILFDSKDWVLSPKPDRPADDPFMAYNDALSSKELKSLGPQDQSEAKCAVLEQMKSLSMPVIGSKDMSHPARGTAMTYFERIHQAFLVAGGHWDDDKQRYVGRDGSYTVTKPRENTFIRFWKRLRFDLAHGPEGYVRNP